MPESRDRLVRGWAVVEPQLGMGSRRGSYQEMLREAAFGTDSRRSFHELQAMRNRRQWLEMGTENTLPGGGSGSGLRRRGSPLPAWHPRTPLRDISAIVNAMERRRSAQRTASRRRRNHTTEFSSPSASETPPLPRGLSEPNPVVCEVSDTSPVVTATNLSATESSPQTPSDAITTASDNSKLADFEARLEKSIDVIEKAVKKTLKRTVKVNDEKKKQRRTLMSMR